MDSDTRDFIIQQNDKLYKAMGKLGENVDNKLGGLQETLAEQNLKLGQGSERFESIKQQFEDNKSWHRTLLTLILLLFSAITTVSFKFFK